MTVAGNAMRRFPTSERPCSSKSKPRFDTSTVAVDGTLVPWLSASEPLFYSPTNPPEGPELFHYKKIMPEIFHYDEPGDIVKREGGPTGLFGDAWADNFLLLHFWNEARRKNIGELGVSFGTFGPNSFHAPIAVYTFGFGSDQYYLFLQNGSYQYVSAQTQPYLEHGLVLLHRGVGESKNFVQQCFPSNSRPLVSTAIACHDDFCFKSFSDSRDAFLTATYLIGRSQTKHLSSRTIIPAYLETLDSEPMLREFFSRILRATLRQAFTLHEWIAKETFGPSHVSIVTPVTNIRITPHFAGEGQVTLLNPNKVEFVAASGCGVYYYDIPFDER